MEAEIKCRIEKGELIIDHPFEEVDIQVFKNDGTLYKQFKLRRGNQPVSLPEKETYLVVIQTVNRTFVRIIKKNE